mmetsp:Transcript_17389/g.20886  ORF Transcript_17389/g.20886 Transcript_17389/m.20886 type:complete len:81 (-) Transcript_17389:1349-1591(-)
MLPQMQKEFPYQQNNVTFLQNRRYVYRNRKEKIMECWPSRTLSLKSHLKETQKILSAHSQKHTVMEEYLDAQVFPKDVGP